jgi:hypothetical protein
MSSLTNEHHVVWNDTMVMEDGEVIDVKVGWRSLMLRVRTNITRSW